MSSLNSVLRLHALWFPSRRVTVRAVGAGVRLLGCDTAVVAMTSVSLKSVETMSTVKILEGQGAK